MPDMASLHDSERTRGGTSRLEVARFGVSEGPCKRVCVECGFLPLCGFCQCHHRAPTRVNNMALILEASSSGCHILQAGICDQQRLPPGWYV